MFLIILGQHWDNGIEHFLYWAVFASTECLTKNVDQHISSYIFQVSFLRLNISESVHGIQIVTCSLSKVRQFFYFYLFSIS